MTKGDYLTAEKYFDDKASFIKEISEKIDNFENIEDLFVKESLKAFAWLLSKDLLEIKLAFPKSKIEKGSEAIFHQKIGYCLQ